MTSFSDFSAPSVGGGGATGGLVALGVFTFGAEHMILALNYGLIIGMNRLLLLIKFGS